MLESLQVYRGVPRFVALGRTKPRLRLRDGCAARPCLRTQARMHAQAEHTLAQSQRLAFGWLSCTPHFARYTWVPHRAC
jgi:hypothetical protein